MERPARGDEMDVTVDDLAFGGRGVARADGFVVFTPDTAPGDVARVRLHKVRRRFGEAELVEVISPGPGRITPPCHHVPDCGGCRLQHVAYEEVLEAKRVQIAEHLARIGGLRGIDVLDPDPAAERFGYRNKMEYSAAPGPDGSLHLGFHKRGRWDEVVDIDPCLLATEVGNIARRAVRAWAVDEDLRPFDQRRHEGFLRHVVVREGVLTGQVLVTIVTAPGPGDCVDRLAERLPEVVPGLVGIVHAVNAGLSEVTSGLPSRTVWGRDWIEEIVEMEPGHPVTLRLSATSFFQTNSRMTGHLYRRAAEAAGLTGGEVLYDLFSGVGSIGVALGSLSAHVVAIELLPEAVEDSRGNAERNGVTNHTAIAGDVRVVLREQRGQLPAPDVAIVDPPRGGLSGGACRRILELAPKTLVYVSCQPATFADNAKRFVDGGYRLEWVRPVDMFPQTPHIEAVARFTLP
ncbi:MAG: 23S rRNA (uracil(1939)-C(5))-methyltransferase RlmD [Thermoleophilia bacterium]|nr:23S rRNA (uracil(1939)-C(5))-methyltransferase RlmD [Thermoleophilia bacterium]